MSLRSYLADKFGPDRWAAYILDPALSPWDVWALVFVLFASIGERQWTIGLVIPIWVAGRCWADRRRNG